MQTHTIISSLPARVLLRVESWEKQPRQSAHRAPTRAAVQRSQARSEYGTRESEIGFIQGFTRGVIKTLLAGAILAGASYGALRVAKPDLAHKAEHLAVTQILKRAPAARPAFELVGLVQPPADRTVQEGKLSFAPSANLEQYQGYRELGTIARGLNQYTKSIGTIDADKLAALAQKLDTLKQQGPIPESDLSKLESVHQNLQQLLQRLQSGEPVTPPLYKEIVTNYLVALDACKNILSLY